MRPQIAAMATGDERHDRRAAARDVQPSPHLGLGDDAPHGAGQVLAELARRRTPHRPARRAAASRGRPAGRASPSIVKIGGRQTSAAASAKVPPSILSMSADTSAQLRATATATAATTSRASTMRRTVKTRARTHQRLLRVSRSSPYAVSVRVEVPDASRIRPVMSPSRSPTRTKPRSWDRARTPRTSAGPRAPSALAGPIGSVTQSSPPDFSAQRRLAHRLVDVVGVAAAGVQPDDDVERRGVDVEHLDAGAVAGELELDRGEPDGPRPPRQG